MIETLVDGLDHPVGAELERLVCANLGRWHLALVESRLRGAALHYPDTWAADA